VSSKGTSFTGGVHPPHHKQATAGRPIERALIPEQVVIPLSQHLGAPCESVVSKGDHVRRGSVLGTTDAFISAPVHSPVDGTVLDIAMTLTPAGSRVSAVFIEVDAEQDLDSYEPVDRSGSTAETVRAAGIVGMGGAMFPSSVKLTPPKEFDIDTVILNGCECEPFLTCDHRMMLEHPDQVVRGAGIIAEAVGASRIVIGVEDNKPDAIEVLRGSVDDGVEVMELPTKYPQGAEKQLISVVLGKEVPKGKLPAATGAVVHNVGTAVAIAEAVDLGKPLIERVVTVTGAVTRPGNYLTLIGTSIADLIANAGGLVGEVEKVIAGGPMTGFALATLDVPVVKGTSGVVVLRVGESGPEIDEDQPCIRCGRCVEYCPTFLQPFAIADHANVEQWERTADYHVLDCIECAVCSYVCPTRRPLLQLIRRSKGALLAKGVKP